MNRNHPKFGTHAGHCWQNEYPDGCKYGPAHACPAQPDVWPHPTYNENGDNVWVTRTLNILPRPGRAWGKTVEERYIFYVHKDNPNGVVFKESRSYIEDYYGGKIPDWAVEIEYDEGEELTFAKE